jgi:hypothetical protein
MRDTYLSEGGPVDLEAPNTARKIRDEIAEGNSVEVAGARQGVEYTRITAETDEGY